MSFESLVNISKGLPQLDIGHRRGMTQYIDFLKDNDVPQKLMGGIDCYRRHFITFKGYVQDTYVMETIFQRYTPDNIFDGFWLSCGHGTPKHLLKTDGGINSDQIEFYQTLFRDGEAVIEEKHRPCSEEWIGKTFTLDMKR